MPCHFVALNPSRGFRRLDARTLTPSRSADSSHILRCVGARTHPTLLRRHYSPDLSTWLNAGTSPNAPPVTRHPSPVTRHPSPVTRHPSPVIRHPSSVIRHPSSHYQINHNLIFATAIHSQHINHTLIFKLTPPEPHNQSQLNLHIDHQLINKFSAYNPLHLIRINGHALSRKSS